MGPPVVLVIDDAAATRDLYEAVLSMRGFRCVSAADPETAVKRVLSIPLDAVAIDLGQRCAVCAVPISEQELQREVDFETGETLRLHGLCFDVWSDERWRFARWSPPPHGASVSTLR